MKTSYKILWIDDEPTSVTDDRESVKDFLDQFGIRADTIFIEAPTDGSIKDKIAYELQDPDLDLLMVDFNMNGLRGDELIRLIQRTDHVYLPVIFYSSSEVNTLFDAVKEQQLDGVYVANRRFLITKFEEVVRSLLAKEQTVKQVRGLLMEGVSEIDAQFNELFLQFWAKLDADQRESLRKYVLDIFKDRKKSSENKFNGFPKDHVDFDTHIVEQFLTPSYDTYTRWRIVKKALEVCGHKDAAAIAVLTKFAKVEGAEINLNSLRNDYAHKTRSTLEKSHGADICVEIRRSLHAHFSNIDLIKASG